MEDDDNDVEQCGGLMKIDHDFFEKYYALKSFKQHGVKFTGLSGDSQATAHCPFCNKHSMYVNHKTKAWDCKKCQKSGGFPKFLEEISIKCAKEANKLDLKRLSEEKSISVNTFKRWQVGYNPVTQRYTIPVPNLEYGLSDLRLYKLGDKVHSCKDAKINILNLRSLQSDKKNTPVYVCEGDWDFLVMDEIIHRTGITGLAIGIPGAATFKLEWVQLFRNKTVHFVYDNDQAGIKGENKAYNLIKAIAQKVTFTHWNNFKDGYDLRDYFKDNECSVTVTLAKLKKLFKDQPRPVDIEAKELQENTQLYEKRQRNMKRVPYLDILDGYKKWLHIPNTDFINVQYATILANRLQGEPIWMFLVAPPGSSKSVTLMSFQNADRIMTTTSITPHALISGFSGGGGDPSLIPRLDGKVLIIKDFTTVLSMPVMQLEEIFGILRDAYDGRVEKQFGNMVMRVYDSKFGMICGVTPAIDVLGDTHSSLGERFLKYRYRYDDWYDVIKRALGNTNKENSLRTELSELATRALDFKYENYMPEIDNATQEDFIQLAQWTAIMRGSVTRDKYTNEILFKPSPEIGTRLVKQFSKLALGLAMFRGTQKVYGDDYRIVVQVARDTLTEKNEEIFRKIFLKDKDHKWTIKEVAQIVKLPDATCSRVLHDLTMLKVLSKEKNTDDNKILFTVTDMAKELTIKAKVYQNYQ